MSSSSSFFCSFLLFSFISLLPFSFILGEDGNGARSTRLFELVWFHALSVSRGTFGALGYSGGPYVLTAGLELGLGVKEMEMVHERVLDYKSDFNHSNGGISLLRDAESLTELAGKLVTDIHYGGHVGDPEDRIILGALWDLSRNASKSLGGTTEGYQSLDQHRMFVRGLEAEPVLPGLAVDAVVARRVVESHYLMERFCLSINTSTRKQIKDDSNEKESKNGKGIDLQKDEKKAEIEANKGGMFAALAAMNKPKIEEVKEEIDEDIEELLREEHVVEWTAAFPSVRDQIILVVGTLEDAKMEKENLEHEIKNVIGKIYKKKVEENGGDG